MRRLPGRSEVFPLLELFTLGFAFEISEYGVVPYKTCKRICTATGLLGILGHSLEAPPTCLNSRGALGGDSKSFTLFDSRYRSSEVDRAMLQRCLWLSFSSWPTYSELLRSASTVGKDSPETWPL